MELRNDCTNCDGDPVRVGDTVWTGRGVYSTVLALEVDESGLVTAKLADGRELFPSVLRTNNVDNWSYLYEDMKKALEGFAARAKLLMDGGWLRCWTPRPLPRPWK